MDDSEGGGYREETAQEFAVRQAAANRKYAEQVAQAARADEAKTEIPDIMKELFPQPREATRASPSSG